MKNLIEYLMLFLIVILFSSNGMFDAIFICASIAIYVLYLIVFLIKNKNEEKGVRSLIPSMDFFISSVMIVCLNLVQELSIANIAFGCFLNAILLCYLCKSLIKKEYSFNKKIYESKHIFDVYVVLYLVNLLIALLIHQI